ncbi:muropeptide MFS transporter AmpG, partial [Candidatus Symbiopectobacterium sp. NZEC135]|nr:muropeptide MFS transporter AmpG [Candidatus Symbiopectobacterium sp. NZEC135]
AVSNAGYWLLAITTKHLVSMAGVIFLENLCGGMGTAAFVALLMTLCNTSFSATQFALLSALSAVGRVYVGPIAGWFVETHGWAWFYLFTIAVSVPGLVLLLVCRQTLEYTQRTGTFMVRMTYPRHYRFALRMLAAGCALLFIWLTLTIAHALGANAVEAINDNLLMLGCILVIAGTLLGSFLDYLSLRNSHAADTHK